jgi:hypothetical protein
MNCEKCQELVSDLLDGSIRSPDELVLNQHLEQCLECSDVHRDLETIVGFCRTNRGEYAAPPNERALWLRIRNIIESETAVAGAVAAAAKAPAKGTFGGWLGRTWELSLPQLAASVAGIVLVVSLSTMVLMRRSDGIISPHASNAVINSTDVSLNSTDVSLDVNSRMWQQQQAISYWNQRIEMNKARWSQDMRDTFERNLKVIDQAVNDSITELNRNPHDEVSEEMLNTALNEKLTLLKEFADL